MVGKKSTLNIFKRNLHGSERYCQEIFESKISRGKNLEKPLVLWHAV
jgi:hypothetical protein